MLASKIQSRMPLAHFTMIPEAWEPLFKVKLHFKGLLVYINYNHSEKRNTTNLIKMTVLKMTEI